MSSRLLFCAASFLVAASALAQKDAGERHVVLVVWDGMRPDFVNENYSPNLDKLARAGIRFRNHHSVYPTATDVNGAALATGCYPNRSGLCANTEFRPAIDSSKPVDTSEPATIKRGDEISNGNYLAVPTFPELLRKAGKSVVLVGAKSVALLFDRKNDWAVTKSARRALTVFAAAPLKATQHDELTKTIGPFPDDDKATAAQRNSFATRALTQFFWRDAVPDFSLLWLSEPDLSEHNFAPGSPQAIAAIKDVDANLGQVLAVLEAKHARQSTDVLVVSDHGFSTIRRSFDLVALLNAAGFHAGKELSDSSRAGDIVLAGNAGTVLFYVQDHEGATTQRLVDWLERRDFAGAIFTREKADGAFALDHIHMATPAAADVVMTFRWYDGEKNQYGAAGMIDADWNRPAGDGTHATWSTTDVHNTFIAAGPDFRPRAGVTFPTGNIDLAPTILTILGVDGAEEMDGRLLTRSFERSPLTKRLETSRRLDTGTWKQSLNAITVGNATYFEGAK